MIRTLLATLGACIVFAVYGQEKENRPVSGFTGINASSVFEIIVKKGDAESLSIEADSDVLPYVHSDVKGKTLHLYLDNSDKKKLVNIKKLKAYIVMKNLEDVSLSGACKLSCNDLFSPDQFDGNCSGVSDMILKLKTNYLNIGLSGSSSVQLKADVADEADWHLSGVSKISAEMNTKKALLSASGASKVELSGTANVFEVGISGPSNVNAIEFVAQTASVKSSGTSTVKLNVIDKLKVKSSGTSTIVYKGSPDIEQQSSGISTIRKY